MKTDDASARSAGSSNRDAGASTLAETAGHVAVSVALGFPIPAPIQRSLWKSVAVLITSSADIPVAYMQSIAEGIRLGAKEREIVRLAAANATAASIADRSVPSSLQERALDYGQRHILREQRNREAVLLQAVENLKAQSVHEEAASAAEPLGKEIDEDWLHAFAERAGKISNVDMQALLARLLQEEINTPGSFSIDTVYRAVTMPPRVARLFQTFCNHSISFGNIGGIVAGPFSPQRDGLPELGLNYDALTDLQTAGLIRSDLGTYVNTGHYTRLPFEAVQFDFCRKAVELRPMSKLPDKLPTVLFTAPGLELRAALALELPRDDYFAKLTAWFAEREMVCRLVDD